MHPLNHIPLSLMEEKALWQYTRYVYSNQVDTYVFDQLLSGITERIEEQWQISISPDDLELRYDENQGLEVFQVTPDQPFWNLRNLLDQYRPQGPNSNPYIPDTTDGAPYPILNQYSNERRSPRHQLMFTVVEWNGGTPAVVRDLMVTETNLETGRPREHQVEFFFFKLVGDWPMAQRMGNYWRQHYGLDTYPIDTPPEETPAGPPTPPTDALDTPTLAVVQLIRELRNLPGAASMDEYHHQLLSLVGTSGVVPAFTSTQLSTLATQFQQLADIVTILETRGPVTTTTSLPVDTSLHGDAHLTDMDDDENL
eukprot:s1881_g11.t1